MTVIGCGASLTTVRAEAPTQRATPELLRLDAQELALGVDAPLSVSFTPTTPLPTDGLVVVTAYRKVTTRGDLTVALSGTFTHEIDTIDLPVSALAVGADGTLTATIPTESSQRTAAALQLPSAGMYPLSIVVSAGGEAVAELRTVVDRLPDATEAAGAPLQVSVVASLTAPPQIPGSSTPLPDEVVAAANRLAALSPEVRATISISPEILSRLDTTTLDTVRTALQNSRLLSQPRYPFDPSIAAVAGQNDLFGKLLVDGETIIETVAETSPTDRSLWIAPSALSTAGAALLRGLGVRMAVLTPEAFSQAANSEGIFTDTSQKVMATLGTETLPLAVIDLRSAQLLESTDGSAEQRALYAAADLVVARDEFAKQSVRGHTLFIGTPTAGVPNVAVLNRMTAMTTATGAISFLTLDEALTRTDQLPIDGLPHTVVLPDIADNGLAARIGRINDVSNIAVATASMLAPDDIRRNEWLPTLEALASTALSDAAADAAMSALSAEMAGIQHAVVLPTAFSFTLSGRQTTIPVVLQNTSDRPLTVKVRLRSSKMTFPDGDQVVTLPPSGSHEVPIAAAARSNGSFGVELTVLTPAPDGAGREVLIAPAVTLRARVSTFTGLAQVLTGGGLLMVLAWWFKNARGSRRRRLLASAVAHPAGPPSPDAAVGLTSDG